MKRTSEMRVSDMKFFQERNTDSAGRDINFIQFRNSSDERFSY